MALLYSIPKLYIPSLKLSILICLEFPLKTILPDRSYIVTLILNGERKSFQAKFNKSDIKVNHLVHTFLVNR